MSSIRVFNEGSREYNALDLAAKMLTILSPKGYKYAADVTYFDFGQDWKWTTVICSTGWDRYQALNPKEQELIMAWAESPEMICQVCRDVLADPHCPDRE